MHVLIVFRNLQFVKCRIRKFGSKIYLASRGCGEITFHEAWILDRYSHFNTQLYFNFSKPLAYPEIKFTKARKMVFNFFNSLSPFFPLGGYREYRPQIIRYDTFMPVTIGMIYLFGLTTYHLIVNLNWRKYYISTIAGVLLIFIWIDKIDNTNQLCEVEALTIISESKEEIVELDNQCPIIEYHIVHDPGHSNLKANLLYHWNVTEKVTMFYQRE